MKIRKILLTLLTAFALMPSVSYAQCDEVTLTEMNWASSAIVTAVAKFVMEQGYDCTVKIVPSATVTAVTSVAETGKPDVVTELWTNNIPIYHELVAEGKMISLGEVLSDGGIEGWWIPFYLLEEYPVLATIDGILANPELVNSRFHNCPDGWACRTNNDKLIDEYYNLPVAGIEVFNHGSGETLATSLASAYESKQPWFGYYWAPTALLGRYDMVLVKSSKDDPEDQLKAHYPGSVVITSVTTDFQNKEPEVATMLSKLSFTNEQMGSLLAWQQDNNATTEETAVYFLTNHGDVWSSWLNSEARKKLSALL